MTPRVGLYTNLIAIHYSIVLDCIVYMGVLTEPNTRLSGSFHTHTHTGMRLDSGLNYVWVVIHYQKE